MPLSKSQVIVLWRIATSERPLSISDLMAMEPGTSRATLQTVINALLRDNNIEVEWDLRGSQPKRAFNPTAGGRQTLESERMPAYKIGEHIEVRLPGFQMGMLNADDKMVMTNYMSTEDIDEWFSGTVRGVRREGEYVVEVDDPQFINMRFVAVIPRRVRAAR